MVEVERDVWGFIWFNSPAQAGPRRAGCLEGSVQRWRSHTLFISAQWQDQKPQAQTGRQEVLWTSGNSCLLCRYGSKGVIWSLSCKSAGLAETSVCLDYPGRAANPTGTGKETISHSAYACSNSHWGHTSWGHECWPVLHIGCQDSGKLRCCASVVHKMLFFLPYERIRLNLYFSP